LSPAKPEIVCASDHSGPRRRRPLPSDLKIIRLGRYYSGMRIDTPEDAHKPIHGAVRNLSHEAVGRGSRSTPAESRSLVANGAS
jgi:hypothetical protein